MHLGASVAAMIDAISHHRNRLMPCNAILEGEYGEADIAMGVPCVLSRQGLVRVIDLGLNEAAMEMFKESAAGVRADIALMPAPD